jgi:hypothetical protein
MSNAHTPAPWVVGPVDDTVVTHLGRDGVRYEIAAIDGDYNSPDEWPTMEANARLIAAAPTMLAALRGLLEDAKSYGMADSAFSGSLIEAAIAIAKAEGRT